MDPLMCENKQYIVRVKKKRPADSGRSIRFPMVDTTSHLPMCRTGENLE